MTLSHATKKNNATRKTIVCITSRFAPANGCVLSVLVKLAFVALFSGTVWVDGSSSIFIFGAGNVTSWRPLQTREKIKIPVELSSDFKLFRLQALSTSSSCISGKINSCSIPVIIASTRPSFPPQEWNG